MRRTLAGLVVTTAAAATAVLPAVATPAPAAAPAPGPLAGLTFGACPSDLAQRFPAMTCATLKVPLDYTRPFGATVSLLITKVAARDPAHRKGALLVNPGGPGGGGAAYAGSLTAPNASGYTRIPGTVLDVYDVIGMDPRGVAHSTPAATCVAPDYFAPPQPDPDAAQNRTELWKVWNDYSNGCAAKSSALLPYVGTVNVARDMDRLREALGETKLNFFGASYGSYLGAVYGELFAARVGKMVIDGLVNPVPQQMWYEAAKAQAPALQKRLESWFTWIAQYDSVFHLGTTTAQVRAAWNTTLASWRVTPHGDVGGNELLFAAYNSMFSESVWIPFAQALSAYVVGGDDTALREYAAADTSPDNEQFNASFNAVICIDSVWPRDRATFERDTDALARAGAQMAWFNMWTSGSACQNWSVPAGQRVALTGKGMPRILMLNSVGDPATPYDGALKMHQTLPNSVLVTEKDAGKHVVFASAQAQANPQANAIVARYLVDGVLPATDTTVPGHPLPVPTAAALRQPAGPLRAR